MYGYIKGVQMYCRCLHITAQGCKHGTNKDGGQGTEKVRSWLSVGCMIFSVQCSCPHQHKVLEGRRASAGLHRHACISQAVLSGRVHLVVKDGSRVLHAAALQRAHCNMLQLRPSHRHRLGGSALNWVPIFCPGWGLTNRPSPLLTPSKCPSPLLAPLPPVAPSQRALIPPAGS